MRLTNVFWAVCHKGTGRQRIEEKRETVQTMFMTGEFYLLIIVT